MRLLQLCQPRCSFRRHLLPARPGMLAGRGQPTSLLSLRVSRRSWHLFRSGLTADHDLYRAVCTGAAPTGAVPTASFVTNSWFPYPYAPTSFANPEACTTAVEQCSSNYAACTSDLAGSGWGVTIVVPGGGGTTVAPTDSQVPIATATSVCSSLSSEACHGLQTSQCTGSA